MYPTNHMWYHVLEGEVDMRIESFSMTGYRGVRGKQTISLSPQVNILFGENGAGKSTVLYGMMTALSWFAARVRSTYGNGNLVEYHEINNQCNHSELSIACRTAENQLFTWSINKSRKGIESLEKSDYSQLNVITQSLQRAREEHGVEISLPIIGLYPTSRAGLDIPNRIRKRHIFDSISLYDSDQIWNSDFRLFYEWFSNQQAIENEHYRISGNTNIEDRSLNAVRKAIHTFMRDFSNLHFQFISPQGLYVEKKDFGLLRIEQLSGGEQSLLALVGDIARRLVIANPTLPEPLLGRGIILIDEVDVHLHPTWQYSVVENLRNTFPNCQFILTSHAPSIISQGKPGEVYRLSVDMDTISITQGVPSYGKEMDEIYQDFLGLQTIRPKEIYHGIKEIYALMETDLDEAEERLKELQQTIHNDSGLEKIQMLITRRRTIGI